MGLRKRIKNSNRGGIPTSVSPYPEKLPYGLLPWSFTFDFSQDPPADLSDYLNNTHSTTRGFYYTSGSSNLTEQYNQTVAGRDECVVYTVDSNYASGPDSAQFEFVFNPNRLSGQNQYGRISSSLPTFPITVYSTATVSFEYYLSGYNTSGSHAINFRGLSYPTGFWTSGFGGAVVEDQWTTVTLSRQHTSDHNAASVRVGDPTSDSGSPLFNEDGGYLAIRNLTFSLDP